MTNDPTHFNIPEIDCLKPSQIDNVGRALITLLRENAVLSDRLHVLEDILIEKGLLTVSQIDTHQPSDACIDASRKSMATMAGHVIRALEGTDAAG